MVDTMNALRRTAMTVLPRASRTSAAAVAAPTRRTMAAESRKDLHTGWPTTMAELKNNIWLSDPGAYPVLGVLGFALSFCTAFMAWGLARNQDVRIMPSKRQGIVRTWEH